MHAYVEAYAYAKAYAYAPTYAHTKLHIHTLNQGPAPSPRDGRALPVPEAGVPSTSCSRFEGKGFNGTGNAFMAAPLP